jgi:hypothetical protein
MLMNRSPPQARSPLGRDRDVDCPMLRTGLATVLLLLFIPTVVAANTSVWARRTVLDADAFSTTVADALERPAIEEAVASTIASEIVDSLAGASPATLDLLATQELNLPSGSTADQIEAALNTRIIGATRTATIQRIRDEIVVEVHEIVVGAIKGEPGLVTVRGDEVILDKGRLLDRLADANPQIVAAIALSGLGGQGSIVIAHTTELEPVQRTLGTMEALELTVPLLAAAIALLIVVLAHRRERALGFVGLAITLAGLVSIVLVWLAGESLRSGSDAPIARQITGDVGTVFLAVLREQAIVLVIVGMVIAVAAWVLARRARRRATARMLGPRG